MNLTKTKSIIAALALVVITSLAASANATLIGSTVTTNGYSLSPSSSTIGSGVEFIGVWGNINFDFGADTLTVTPNQGVSWWGFGNYVFSGFNDPITSFSIASNTGFTGSIVDNFSFTSNSITLDMSSASSGGSNTELVFDINGSGTTAPVPEPGTIALLGLGMAGLAIFGKRRMNKEA